MLGGAVAGGVLLGASARATAAEPPRATGQRSMANVPFAAVETVKIGLIGLGNRVMGMVTGWTDVPGTQVVAVCDIRADRAKTAADRVAAKGKPRPKEYGGTSTSYEQMLSREELDLVYIATPWEFHYTHGKAALKAGAHVGVELPIATQLSELWDLVNTSESTRKHLWLMENCSYGRNELAMLKMAHEGVFGDVTSGHGGYLHDLRSLLFNDGYYTDDWRRLWHTRSTASFYPMHGLAPIAAAMDINRGDRMTTLSATSTEPKGLADYRERFVPRDHRSWKETYVNGDLTTCMINTAQGRTIRAEHNVSQPRPYSRINSLEGSHGVFEDYVGGDKTGARVYVEPNHSGDAWRGFEALRGEFDHWLWKELEDDAAGSGHGGMDYVLQWRIIQQMRAGLVPDIDVYDSAAWCAPVPLSVVSLADKGRPVAIPDFTRGQWQKLRPGLDSKPSAMPPVPAR
ncbi:glycosyl hydrolase [Luteipulveratus mongoliensis]|uniref:Glycosyl hydrolase n=1 Tax=Luteipulveratus mongoliensis TaxID=571913 RepID=A0A0K1JQ03_9MICO|nr:glycosyl hydrolase [Luteipulveratus mongoliensis]